MLPPACLGNTTTVPHLSKQLSIDRTFVFPHNSYVEAPNSQGGGVWRWGLWEVKKFVQGHESGALMMWIEPL